MHLIRMEHGFSILMEIIYDHLLFPEVWFVCNSILHWQDIFAGYEIDCLRKKKSPLFQIEITFNDIWIFLMTSVFFVEKPILVLHVFFVVC